jgi:asparagine synthase (glutamine-hydrolysing)
MSIIFGVRRAADEIVTTAELRLMSLATACYAHDGTYLHSLGRVGLGLQPYHTHDRSTFHSRPEVDAHGNAVVFDGRLDNFEDLLNSLNADTAVGSDGCIVMAAFERWGEQCFSKLIGEWAVALWSAKNGRLYLARDHAGTRTLYFSTVGGTLRWSTYLETLVCGEHQHDLSRDYMLCYIAGAPMVSLTPYQGIETVAPAQYIVAADNHIVKRHHWNCSEQPHIRCRSESEYVDRFLGLLGQSVTRRSGPGAKTIAHLSGGMDSTSIVCMSDYLRKLQDPSASLLDTISFFDDSEPGWDEGRYFSVVEAQRGKVGIHVRTSSSDQSFLPAKRGHGVYLFPGRDSLSIEQELVLKGVLADHGYRVILCGIGGDEVLGGVPDPLPELSSLLVSGHLRRLASKGVDWCLTRRSALVHLLFNTVSFTKALYLKPSAAYGIMSPSWLRIGPSSSLARPRDDAGLLHGELNQAPNDICNRLAWRSALATLPSLTPDLLARYDYRYPLLDRDLVEYAFSLPREQLVRPGRRRYLMRKALVGIVPTEILERKRKAFVARSPLVSLREAREAARPALRGTIAAEFGIIDQPKFTKALDALLRGEEVDFLAPILRTINIELWLQDNLTAVSPPGDKSLAEICARKSARAVPRKRRGI